VFLSSKKSFAVSCFKFYFENKRRALKAFFKNFGGKIDGG
jgi:hypothetical protein